MRDGCQVCEGWVVATLVCISRRTNQPNLATAGERTDVEDLEAFGGSKLGNEVAQRRNAPSIEAPMQMISTKAQEHFRSACFHPVGVKKALHDSFASNRRIESGTGRSVYFHAQGVNEAIS